MVHNGFIDEPTMYRIMGRCSSSCPPRLTEETVRGRVYAPLELGATSLLQKVYSAQECYGAGRGGREEEDGRRTRRKEMKKEEGGGGRGGGRRRRKMSKGLKRMRRKKEEGEGRGGGRGKQDEAKEEVQEDGRCTLSGDSSTVALVEP